MSNISLTKTDKLLTLKRHLRSAGNPKLTMPWMLNTYGEHQHKTLLLLLNLGYSNTSSIKLTKSIFIFTFIELYKLKNIRVYPNPSIFDTKVTKKYNRRIQ